MIWLLRDFDLLSVLLRAATLALEALTLGGVAYFLVVAGPARVDAAVIKVCRRGISIAALALTICEVCYVAIDSAILMSNSGLSFREVAGAAYFVAGAAAACAALGILFFVHGDRKRAHAGMAFSSLLLLGAAVSASHSFSRLDQRALLVLLTLAHHAGAAIWIGAMPFLLVTLRRAEVAEARRLIKRFSAMALAGAGMLLAGGAGMAWFYLGASGAERWNGLYGTAYGVMLLAKVYLFLMVVGLGAGNFFVARQIETAPLPLLERLRHFGEVEIGLAFTAILAAASMTSQPPAVDLAQDRVKVSEIAKRMYPVWPTLSSPPVAALAQPKGSMENSLKQEQFSSGGAQDENDRAWSEYNHHWAGLIVLAAGALALLSRIPRAQWARNWPLVFAGLAVFIVMRADPEAWPLGLRPFWASFAWPDVLEHRMYALLIVSFAAFEWGVETGRLHSRHAAMVFPLLCAAGGALLLTHNHSLGNVKEELLVEMSHTPIALLGATAGWGRWLELRRPGPGESSTSKSTRIASFLWPVCLMLVGLVLLNYREA